MIGEVAENNVGMMQRVYREGHEIGNHTFTHPDISEISNAQVDLQLNLTERLFASKLGVQPLYFRPPYSIDQEPDTNDQAAPVDRIQGMGYVIVGNKIDTNDWDEHPRKTPQEITDSVFQQIADMNVRTWTKGSVILLHDGGGDRSATIAALPVLIEALRAHGYEIVPVSELLGKTRAEVMPPLTPHQRWQARADSITFFFVGFFNNFVDRRLLRWRRPDERTAHHHRHLRRHRPAAQAEELCNAGLSAQGRGADPRVQRGEGDRADDPLGDDVERTRTFASSSSTTAPRTRRTMSRARPTPPILLRDA